MTVHRRTHSSVLIGEKHRVWLIWGLYYQYGFQHAELLWVSPLDASYEDAIAAQKPYQKALADAPVDLKHIA